MKLTKQQLKQIIREELAGIPEGDVRSTVITEREYWPNFISPEKSDDELLDWARDRVRDARISRTEWGTSAAMGFDPGRDEIDDRLPGADEDSVQSVFKKLKKIRGPYREPAALQRHRDEREEEYDRQRREREEFNRSEESRGSAIRADRAAEAELTPLKRRALDLVIDAELSKYKGFFNDDEGGAAAAVEKLHLTHPEIPSSAETVAYLKRRAADIRSGKENF